MGGSQTPVGCVSGIHTCWEGSIYIPHNCGMYMCNEVYYSCRAGVCSTNRQLLMINRNKTSLYTSTSYLKYVNSSLHWSRLSTIQDADCIAVIQDGQVVEVGSHGELLKREGYYSRLHRLQVSGPTSKPQIDGSVEAHAL